VIVVISRTPEGFWIVRYDEWSVMGETLGDCLIQIVDEFKMDRHRSSV